MKQPRALAVEQLEPRDTPSTAALKGAVLDPIRAGATHVIETVMERDEDSLSEPCDCDLGMPQNVDRIAKLQTTLSSVLKLVSAAEATIVSNQK